MNNDNITRNCIRKLEFSETLSTSKRDCLHVQGLFSLWSGNVLICTAVEMDRRLSFTFIGEIKVFVSVLYPFTACDYSKCINRQ